MVAILGQMGYYICMMLKWVEVQMTAESKARRNALEENTRKLAKVSELIKGDNFEKNISLLNKLLRKASQFFIFLHPVSGTVLTPAILTSEILDDVLAGLAAASRADIDRTFVGIVDAQGNQLEFLFGRVEQITPKAAAIYDRDKWCIKSSHGITSVTEHDSNRISLNFTEPLADSDDYLALCNVAGAWLDVTTGGIEVVFPKNFDPHTGAVKVVLNRITGFR